MGFGMMDIILERTMFCTISFKHTTIVRYKKCDGNSCEYNSMTIDVEIIKDWLESNYD